MSEPLVTDPAVDYPLREISEQLKVREAKGGRERVLPVLARATCSRIAPLRTPDGSCEGRRAISPVASGTIGRPVIPCPWPSVGRPRRRPCCQRARMERSNTACHVNLRVSHGIYYLGSRKLTYAHNPPGFR